MLTINDLLNLAPAPWMFEDADRFAVRWGEGYTSTVLTVTRSRDGFTCRAEVDHFFGEASAEMPDELPAALRKAYAGAVLSVQARGIGSQILAAVEHAPAWLRGGILPTLDREAAVAVRALAEARERVANLERLDADLKAQRAVLVGLL